MSHTKDSAVEFLREFSQLLNAYGVTLNDMKMGRFKIGNCEVLLDSLTWNNEQFSGQVLANVCGSHSEVAQINIPNYIYAGDQIQHLCVYCRSSRHKNFWGRRTNKCINPYCFNYYDRRGFGVIQKSNLTVSRLEQEASKNAEKQQGDDGNTNSTKQQSL